MDRPSGTRSPIESPHPPSGAERACWSLVAHVHTSHSIDSLTAPRALVARAAARGVDVLAVSDHNSWWGSVEAAEEAGRLGLPLRVILAAEVSTDRGDLIGLFLNDDPRQRSASDFCAAVHDQGGLVLLPHPFRWGRPDDELLEGVDLIEVFNARSPDAENALAVELARERGLPELAGADAHRLAELELARVEFEGELPGDEPGLKHALLHAPRRHLTARGSIWDDWLSQGVSLLKRPSGRLAWSLVRGALRRVVRPGEFALG